jgi:amidase
VYVGVTDGAVKGSPACHRAVLETVDALRKEGHECVQIDPPDCACKGNFLMAELKFLVSAAQALRLFTGITSADGYKKLTEHLGPDKRV